jgi:hypothetical protein
MTLQIELEQETMAGGSPVPTLPGVLTRCDADRCGRQVRLASGLAERLEHGGAVPEFLTVTFEAA